jgi:hypothetical protein
MIHVKMFWLFAMVLVICITLYNTFKPIPTDPLAQQLREVKTHEVQQSLINNYYNK